MITFTAHLSCVCFFSPGYITSMMLILLLHRAPLRGRQQNSVTQPQSLLCWSSAATAGVIQSGPVMVRLLMWFGDERKLEIHPRCTRT